MGRRPPPEADALGGRGGLGEPGRHPAQEVGTPGAAQLRRPGTRGPRAAGRCTHMAGGRRPPLVPGPGRALNLLSFPGGTSTAEETVLPSSPRSPTATEPPGPTRGRGQGPAAEAPREDRLRRPQCGPRPPRVSGGGGWGGSRGAGTRSERRGPRVGRRGTHRLLPRPPARPPGPPLSAVPSPRAPRTRGGRTRDEARPAGTFPARGEGRGGARPPVRGDPSPSRGQLPRPPAPPPALLSLRHFQRGERGRQADREVGEKVACLLGCSPGARGHRLLLWVWYLGSKPPWPPAVRTGR